MSKIKIFFLTILFNISFFAQTPTCVTQNSGTTTQLRSVFFRDLQVGWACGANGTILKTTNGGTNWFQQYTGINNILSAIVFINNSNGFAVGHSGTLLETVNGGDNWSRILISSSANFYDIHFINFRTGWVVGEHGTILKTTDGGFSWVDQSVHYNDLFGCSFIDSYTGCAVGSDPVTIKTNDGGRNWTNSFNSLTGAWLQSVKFVNENVLIAVGGLGSIIKSIDGGFTWNIVNSGTSEHLEDIYMSNSNNGLTVGDHGTILKTTDAGNTWASINSGTYAWLNSVYFPNETTGWIVGNSGVIIKYSQDYTLSVLRNGNCGKVKVNGVLKDLPYSGSYRDTVSLEAVPGPTCFFTGWTGGFYGSLNPAVFQMDGNKTINANFIDTCSLTIVEPTGLSAGQEFDLKIVIDNVPSLKVISFDLTFPSQFINYLSYTNENFIPSGTATVIPDNVNGKVSSSIFSVSRDATGSGFLITFKFKVTGTPPVGSNFQFCFQNVLANDKDGNQLSVSPHCANISFTDLIVWPGDTNNDGLVNIIDINPIVNYFSSTGPSRTPGGILWTTQYSIPWSNVSKTYADCNGNGTVEITDINGVIINFNKAHTPYLVENNVKSKEENKVSKTNIQNPPLSVFFTPGAKGGQEFWVNVNIGSAEFPVSDLKVISFELKYTGTEYIDYIGNELGSFLADYSPTVISEDLSGKINASAFNLTGGRSGYGQAFRFKFKVLDSVRTKHDIMFSWGLVSANKIGGGEQSLDTISFTDGIVPVELESFNASFINNQVHLNWSTATETNNQGFDIERCSLNDGWERISFVQGAGTSSQKHNYSYTDNPNVTGKYSYRIKQIDFDGGVKYSQIAAVEANIILKEYILGQNFPNPFNPTTTISFQLPEDTFVSLTIYDMLGNRVYEMKDEFRKTGIYTIDFNAENLSSGIYLYTLKTNKFTAAKKMILIK